MKAVLFKRFIAATLSVLLVLSIIPPSAVHAASSAFADTGQLLGFMDIEGHPAELDVLFLQNHGIINSGLTNSRIFEPNRYMTNAEAVELVLRVNLERGAVLPVHDLTPSFSDIADHPLRSYIEFAAEIGLVNDEAEFFYPEEPITAASFFDILINTQAGLHDSAGLLQNIDDIYAMALNGISRADAYTALANFFRQFFYGFDGIVGFAFLETGQRKGIVVTLEKPNGERTVTLTDMFGQYRFEMPDYYLVAISAEYGFDEILYNAFMSVHLYSRILKPLVLEQTVLITGNFADLGFDEGVLEYVYIDFYEEAGIDWEYYSPTLVFAWDQWRKETPIDDNGNFHLHLLPNRVYTIYVSVMGLNLEIGALRTDAVRVSGTAFAVDKELKNTRLFFTNEHNWLFRAFTDEYGHFSLLLLVDSYYMVFSVLDGEAVFVDSFRLNDYPILDLAIGRVYLADEQLDRPQEVISEDVSWNRRPQQPPTPPIAAGAPAGAITEIIANSGAGSLSVKIMNNVPADLEITVFADDEYEIRELARGRTSVRDINEGEFVTVNLNGRLPDYFIVRARLIDAATNRDLTEPEYFIENTRLFAEHFLLTVHDFNPESVVKLTDSEFENFVVALPEVTVINIDDGPASLRVVDDYNFVFFNACDMIMNLCVGDRIVISSTRDQLLYLADIISVTISGRTVTIESTEELVLYNFFEHINMNMLVPIEDSGAIPFMRMTSDDDRGRMGIRHSESFSQVVGEGASTIELNMNIDIGVFVRASVQFSVRWRWRIIPVGITIIARFSVGYDATMVARATASTAPADNRPMEFQVFRGRKIFKGFTADIELHLIVNWRANAVGEVTVTASGEAGVYFRNFSPQTFVYRDGPNLYPRFEGSLYFTIGPRIRATFGFMGLISATAWMHPMIEINARVFWDPNRVPDITQPTHHLCYGCLSGDVYFRVNAGFSAQYHILVFRGTIIERTFRDLIRIRLFNFYYSFHNSADSVHSGQRVFDWGTCPNIQRRVVLNPWDVSAGETLRNAEVQVTCLGSRAVVANGIGRFNAFLLPGNYVAEVNDGGVISRTYFQIRIGSTEEWLPNVQVPLESFTLAHSSLDITRGSADSFGTQFSPPYASYRILDWAIGDSGIATVSPFGVITARTRGTTTVSASIGNARSIHSATVNVVHRYVSNGSGDVGEIVIPPPPHCGCPLCEYCPCREPSFIRQWEPHGFFRYGEVIAYDGRLFVVINIDFQDFGDPNWRPTIAWSQFREINCICELDGLEVIESCCYCSGCTCDVDCELEYCICAAPLAALFYQDHESSEYVFCELCFCYYYGFCCDSGLLCCDYGYLAGSDYICYLYLCEYYEYGEDYKSDYMPGSYNEFMDENKYEYESDYEYAYENVYKYEYEYVYECVYKYEYQCEQEYQCDYIYACDYDHSYENSYDAGISDYDYGACSDEPEPYPYEYPYECGNDANLIKIEAKRIFRRNYANDVLAA